MRLPHHLHQQRFLPIDARRSYRGQANFQGRGGGSRSDNRTRFTSNSARAEEDESVQLDLNGDDVPYCGSVRRMQGNESTQDSPTRQPPVLNSSLQAVEHQERPTSQQPAQYNSTHHHQSAKAENPDDEYLDYGDPYVYTPSPSSDPLGGGSPYDMSFDPTANNFGASRCNSVREQVEQIPRSTDPSPSESFIRRGSVRCGAVNDDPQQESVGTWDCGTQKTIWAGDKGLTDIRLEKTFVIGVGGRRVYERTGYCPVLECRVVIDDDGSTSNTLIGTRDLEVAYRMDRVELNAEGQLHRVTFVHRASRQPAIRFVRETSGRNKDLMVLESRSHAK